MKRFLPFVLVCGIAACSASALQSISSATNTAVTDGQLFCAEETVAGPLVVAIVTAATGSATSKPVIATNATATFVNNVCSAINAIPVSPPTNPSTAPTVAVDTTKVSS